MDTPPRYAIPDACLLIPMTARGLQAWLAGRGLPYGPDVRLSPADIVGIRAAFLEPSQAQA